MLPGTPGIYLPTGSFTEAMLFRASAENREVKSRVNSAGNPDAVAY
jgi:hypothetical protein